MPLVHLTETELRTLSPRQLGETVLDRVVGIERDRRHSHPRGAGRASKAYQQSAEEAWRAAVEAERDMIRGTGVKGDPMLARPGNWPTHDEDDEDCS
jgi:hypothetical protein